MRARKAIGLIAAVATTLGVFGAPADAAGTLFNEEVQQQAYGFPLSPGNAVLQFDQFDDMGGTRTLVEVILEVEGRMGADVTLTNLSPQLPLFDPSVTAIGEMQVDFGPLNLSLGYNEVIPCPDQDILFPGQTCEFGAIGASGAEDMVATSNLGAFIGTGTIDAVVEASGSFEFNTEVDFQLDVSNFMGSGLATVTYRWTDTPVIPVPPAVGLGAAGLGLLALRRRRKTV